MIHITLHYSGAVVIVTEKMGRNKIQDRCKNNIKLDRIIASKLAEDTQQL
jgi:predicted protein tyrosine phosphatase